MTSSIATSILEAVSSGLQRKTLNKCSRWTEKCRVMGSPYPGPWSFKHHPWLREMHDAEAEMIIGQKAAQMGYTEYVLNRAFFKIDIRKIDCLYVLPAKNPDAGDFSASRFDSALDLSEHLQDVFSDVKNVGHKRAGTVNMYIRGSRSRSGLKSLPIGLLILDEVDEMHQENIPLAFERQSGQVEKQAILISTPTIDKYGINDYYTKSTQEHFFFTCPCCSRQTELIFPDCLVITGDDPLSLKLKDSHLICKECKSVLDHETKHKWLQSGIWVPQYHDTDMRGFHINQLYSSTIRPWEFAASFLRAQTNPSDEQEFHNSKCGVPHLVKDARINEADLVQCLKGYLNHDKSSPGSLITMGIDIGKWIHFEVVEWKLAADLYNPDICASAKGRVLYTDKVLNFEDLDEVMYEYRPNMTVVDANPERRKAFEFAQRFYGFVKLCFYGNNVKGKYIHEGTTELEDTVTVDRTSWLDLSLGRFRNKTIAIPRNISTEYKENIKALVRIPGKDKDGNPTNRYDHIGADHYGHARNYSEIALSIAAKIGGNISIGTGN